ncbi:MAG: hypothetical protein IJM30_03090 [Thermoguttaceae bacterium]|nr:hypothetical protein [Thermoguttaceae bacterium]
MPADDQSNLNEDDGLSIVDDSQTPSDASSNESKSEEFKLQGDGQYGYRFVPAEQGGGGYEIGSGSASADASALAAQMGSANDAPTIAAPKSAEDEPDVYGLSTPESTPESVPTSTGYTVMDLQRVVADKIDEKEGKKSERRYKPKKGKKVESKKSGSQYDPFADESQVSIDDLYRRKQRDLALEPETPAASKRAKLPERPFWDNLFAPFFSVQTLLRMCLITGAGFITLFPATHFMTRALSKQVSESLNSADRHLVALSDFLSCIWGDKIVLLLFCLVWGVFALPLLMHIFRETASGSDKFSEWPEYSFLGGLGQFAWILCLIGLGGLPGAVVFHLLGLNPSAGFALSATCLLPIFYLSCLQADALFVLLTKDVAKSLKYVASSWGCFFAISYAFLFGTIGYVLFMLWFAVHDHVVGDVGEKQSLGKVALVALLLSLGLTWIPAIYLRLLGRLAWIIEDDIRERAQDEELLEKYEEAEEEAK